MGHGSKVEPCGPRLLKLAQRWLDQSKTRGKQWKPPEGVTQIEGQDEINSPWAAWVFNGHHWRIEGQWRPSILPEEIEEDIGTCKVFVDHEVVLDMTVSSKDLEVMWIDALTVGPWVSNLLAFAGVQSSDAKARSSARSAKTNQEQADEIPLVLTSSGQRKGLAVDREKSGGTAAAGRARRQKRR